MTKKGRGILAGIILVLAVVVGLGMRNGTWSEVDTIITKWLYATSAHCDSLFAGKQLLVRNTTDTTQVNPRSVVSDTGLFGYLSGTIVGGPAMDTARYAKALAIADSTARKLDSILFAVNIKYDSTLAAIVRASFNADSTALNLFFARYKYYGAGDSSYFSNDTLIMIKNGTKHKFKATT